MFRTIRQATEYIFDAAATLVSLMAVLALWPVLNLIRAFRASH